MRSARNPLHCCALPPDGCAVHSTPMEAIESANCHQAGINETETCFECHDGVDNDGDGACLGLQAMHEPATATPTPSWPCLRCAQAPSIATTPTVLPTRYATRGRSAATTTITTITTTTTITTIATGATGATGETGGTGTTIIMELRENQPMAWAVLQSVDRSRCCAGLGPSRWHWPQPAGSSTGTARKRGRGRSGSRLCRRCCNRGGHTLPCLQVLPRRRSQCSLRAGCLLGAGWHLRGSIMV